MTPNTILPTDLNQLRREAKATKQEQGIPHMQALEFVAEHHGFQSWYHVRRCAEGNQHRQAKKSTFPSPTPFRFAVDIKDAMDCNPQQLREAGIVKDDEFEAYLADEFVKAGGDHEDLGDEVVLKHLTAKPKTLEEAIAIVRKHFFFPPLAVWFDDKEVVIDGYVDDDLVVFSSQNET